MTNIASDWVGAGRRRLIKDAHISKKNLKSKQGQSYYCCFISDCTYIHQGINQMFCVKIIFVANPKWGPRGWVEDQLPTNDFVAVQ